MNRKYFLTVVACISWIVGLLALLFPEILLGKVKMAVAGDAAFVMSRTVGVLLISIGCLNFLVRTHQDSPTLRAILIANLLLQLIILPIDPLAYMQGTFKTLGSFVPNTILHFILSGGFIYFILKMKENTV